MVSWMDGIIDGDGCVVAGMSFKMQFVVDQFDRSGERCVFVIHISQVIISDKSKNNIPEKGDSISIQ